MTNIIYTYTDGGSRGNPGPAAIGVVLQTPDGEIVSTYKEFLGHATNNVAEYKALLKALEMAYEAGYEEVHAHLDSELVVKQLKREYKVKHPDMQELFVLVWNVASKFKKVTYTHVRREYNKIADGLVNQSLDEAA